VDVLNKINNLNKMRLSPVWVAIAAIASFRQAAVTQVPAAYAAPINSLTPTTGQTSESSARGSEPEILPAVAREFPSNSVIVQALPVQPEVLQAQAPTTPAPAGTNNTTPNNNPQTPAEPIVPPGGIQSTPIQETPNQPQIPLTPGRPSPGAVPSQLPGEEIPPNQQLPTAAPEPPADPIIRPPGTEAVPQQETPGQIQIPVTPGAPTPGAIPSPPTIPAPAPAPVPPAAQPEPAPELAPPTPAPEAAEPRVLVAEVAVRGEQVELPQELQNQVYGAIRTQPGRTTTRSQLQEDINAIFATGFFSNVRAVPEDTPLGVRVSFVVQPNPVLRNVQVQANPGTKVPSVLPPKVVDDVFREQYGSILNLRRLQEGIKRLNQWYQENGYVLAQVVEAPQVAPDGTVTLQIAEGVVEDIQVRFIREGEATNEEGEPIRGRTRDFIITRELQLEPGEVFNRNTVQTDLQRVYGLGIFEDVQVSLNPGQDPRQVVVLVNVEERRSGSVAAGAGFSSASGLFGTVSYQEQNLGGNNQRLGAELQVGERDVLFDVRFTDPWIAGDPFRTSYTVNGFRRRSISLIFDGDDENIVVGDDAVRPRVIRTGGGVTFTRPLSRNPLERSEWTASAGLQYQRISVRDNDGEISPTGRLNVEGGPQDIPLSLSPDGTDDLLTLQLGAVRDLRNNPLTPTSGSLLRFGVEQSVPIGSGSILLNRLRGSYSQYLPVNFTNFAEGAETLAFNLQAGTVIGDLPPYEAFSVGGTNSVRGYDEGQVGSGRSFVQATAEYRFPIFSVVGGTLFVDVGSDLGTAGNVPGRPGELLDKPGTGFGYGVGVRVQSPLGPLRIDYGFNDEGDSRLHFGIGERF